MSKSEAWGTPINHVLVKTSISKIPAQLAPYCDCHRIFIKAFCEVVHKGISISKNETTKGSKCTTLISLKGFQFWSWFDTISIMLSSTFICHLASNKQERMQWLNSKYCIEVYTSWNSKNWKLTKNWWDLDLQLFIKCFFLNFNFIMLSLSYFKKNLGVSKDTLRAISRNMIFGLFFTIYKRQRYIV